MGSCPIFLPSARLYHYVAVPLLFVGLGTERCVTLLYGTQGSERHCALTLHSAAHYSRAPRCFLYGAMRVLRCYHIVLFMRFGGSKG